MTRAYNRRITAGVLNRCVDAITLREDNSREELADYGVTAPEIIIASDPAVTLPKAEGDAVDRQMRALGLDPAGRYLCFCLRTWPGFEQRADCFAAAAAYAYERYGLTAVFLSANTRGDSTAADMAVKTLRTPHMIVDEPMSTDLIIGILARMQAVVSIRLHGLIFAASQSVPIAGVVYDPKVSAFLDYIGQTNYLPLDTLTEDGLCALVDTALSMDREALRQATERLRSIEQRNTDTARRLLGQ